MTDKRRAPFDRVENGYDPHQVAAFAAEALTWKRDLATTRTALAETLLELEQHIARADTPRGAAGNGVDDSIPPLQPATFQPAAFEAPSFEPTTSEPDSFQNLNAASPDFTEDPSDDGSPWSVGNASDVDPLDAIFEMTLEPDAETQSVTEEVDPEVLREQRVAAAAANLWKRRGVLTPPS